MISGFYNQIITILRRKWNKSSLHGRGNVLTLRLTLRLSVNVFPVSVIIILLVGSPPTQNDHRLADFLRCSPKSLYCLRWLGRSSAAVRLAAVTIRPLVETRQVESLHILNLTHRS